MPHQCSPARKPAAPSPRRWRQAPRSRTELPTRRGSAEARSMYFASRSLETAAHAGMLVAIEHELTHLGSSQSEEILHVRASKRPVTPLNTSIVIFPAGRVNSAGVTIRESLPELLVSNTIGVGPGDRPWCACDRPGAGLDPRHPETNRGRSSILLLCAGTLATRR